MKRVQVCLAIVVALVAVGVTFAQGAADSESPAIEYTTLEDAQVLAADRPTILFFYASWCPTCRQAMSDINRRPDELADLAIVVVNYDNESALKRSYGVTYQHTFVQIDSNGEVLTAWSGGDTDEILEKVIR